MKPAQGFEESGDLRAASWGFIVRLNVNLWGVVVDPEEEEISNQRGFEHLIRVLCSGGE